MRKTESTLLLFVMTVVSPLTVIADEADTAGQASAPVAEINALPPVGAGLEMVKPYQQREAGPRRIVQEPRGSVPRDRVNTPYSREVVPPSYRYGSPGYLPDGRGGRGYDFGYPGYRDQGGGGYPHHRQFGIPRAR